MRALTLRERSLIEAFAQRLAFADKYQLSTDLEASVVDYENADGSLLGFRISNYLRPAYRGQHSFDVEGRMLDADGADVSVILYADENHRLLEMEILRWDSRGLIAPRWETLQLFGAE